MPRLCATLCLLGFITLPAVAADNATGSSTLTFTERSPLSANRDVITRMGWVDVTGDKVKGDYNLSAESFEVVVPADYTGEKPYGLLVFVNPHPSGRPSRNYLDAIARHHLIYIGPNNVGNDRATPIRMGLSIDAVVNMRSRYNIDPKRVYTSGISGGGRVASMLGVSYADLFKGGIYIIGCNFYHVQQSAEQKDANGKPTYFARSYNVPPLAVLKQARKESRHVFITADEDGNREQTWLYYSAFKRDGFDFITYYQVPGLGHQPPDGEWFEEALTFLDKPPATPTAGKATPPPASRVTAVPPRPATRPAAAAAAVAPPGAAAGGTADPNVIADALLTNAKLYVDNKLYERAREKLKWIVTQYPGTRAAAEAKRLLAELPAQ
ncbi:MAG TPA: hypothetical protein VH475_24975 [Tepidisphaeraceae bacterium]|jgi:hypothetical protein